jgi:hypothetical protein
MFNFRSSNNERVILDATTGAITNISPIVGSHH